MRGFRIFYRPLIDTFQIRSRILSGSYFNVRPKPIYSSMPIQFDKYLIIIPETLINYQAGMLEIILGLLNWKGSSNYQ